MSAPREVSSSSMTSSCSASGGVTRTSRRLPASRAEKAISGGGVPVSSGGRRSATLSVVSGRSVVSAARMAMLGVSDSAASADGAASSSATATAVASVTPLRDLTGPPSPARRFGGSAPAETVAPVLRRVRR